MSDSRERLSKPMRCRSCDRERGRVFLAGMHPKLRCLDCADVTPLRCPACLGALRGRPPGVSHVRCLGCQRAIEVLHGRLEYDAVAPDDARPPPAPIEPTLKPDVAASGIEVETTSRRNYRSSEDGFVVRRIPRRFYLEDPSTAWFFGLVVPLALVGIVLGTPTSFILLIVWLAHRGTASDLGVSVLLTLASIGAFAGAIRFDSYRQSVLRRARGLDGEGRLALHNGLLEFGDGREVPIAQVRRALVEKLHGQHRVRVQLEDAQDEVLLDGLDEDDAARVRALVQRSTKRV